MIQLTRDQQVELGHLLDLNVTPGRPEADSIVARVRALVQTRDSYRSEMLRYHRQEQTALDRLAAVEAERGRLAALLMWVLSVWHYPPRHITGRTNL